ncbi:integrin beta-PS [Eurytemora carolleeae]|uniref:integrin beta-PS n=1 Tax=Eurytemora carolleeae TaxID=1294199 RepID=UPI000C762AE0|nr:integrin beta-PS [Eurytemora carolleeae]|eukprot:XP_023340039.1 integrin beta-PS-like [Eurytemora affinis]
MLFLLLVSAVSAQFSYRADRGSGLLIQNPCVSKETCSKCLQTPTCAWCMQPVYNSTDGSPLPRCNQEEFFIGSNTRCESRFIVNPENVYSILQNEEYRKSSSRLEAVQVRPQNVHLSLRVNEAYDLDFYYKQAEDYPVDLYYLMDLSKSMEDDKEKLSALGDLLAETMQNITSNFRLGFGSFVDKVVMPYVSTVPRKLQEPCDGCAAPYGFKHHMRLSTDTSSFAMEVKSAQVSGNLDAPEGGFDAIMQAIACKDIIGWRDKARRLLVFSTDAGFHYAGDGKLGGIVTPNDGACHMDSKGLYTHSEIQDYPSVSQINHKVKENSVNLIFAVTEEQLHVYNALSGVVQGSSYGKLSADSYLGLKVGTQIMFTAKIEVVKCPKDPREWTQTFQIYPVGINESVVVNLEMICQVGKKCGICECPDGYYGQSCECSAKDLQFAGDLEAGCRPDNTTSTVCNNRGDCICGKCECRERENPEERVDGKFCECDNFSCDRFNGELCSGPDHGECQCGKCKCNSEWDVPGYTACECRASNETCITPYGEHIGKLCSGHGTCECGQCKCDEDANGQYSGRHCEDCPTCPGKCQELKGCVQCKQFQSGELHDKKDEFGVLLCDKCPFTPIVVEKAEDMIIDKEISCTLLDDDDCRFTFVYGYRNDTGELQVWVQETKECPVVVDIMGIVLGVIGAIVAIGMALILMWKVFTTIHDRREFAR